MKTRAPLKSSTSNMIHSFCWDSTAAIISAIPFLSPAKPNTAQANHDALMAKADEAIARIDETRAQSRVVMKKSDEVLAEVEANRKRFG